MSSKFNKTKGKFSSSSSSSSTASHKQQQQQQTKQYPPHIRETYNELRNDGVGNGVAGLLCGILRIRAMRHDASLPDFTQHWPTPPYTAIQWPSSSSQQQQQQQQTDDNNNNVVLIPVFGFQQQQSSVSSSSIHSSK